jgi:WG containing repeat
MKRSLSLFGFVALTLALLGCQQASAKFGFIDRTGKMVIPPQFVSADSFSEELALVKTSSRVGYIDRQRKFSLRSKPQFGDGSQDFAEGLAVVEMP